MVDWRNIGVPIIVALIAGGVALSTALINYIIAALFIPNIDISKKPNPEETKNTIIDVTNVGSAPAKGLKLTVQAPLYVSFKHPLFSTERYIENKTKDPTILELYVPRFVHGAGSMITIKTLIDPRANITSDEYIFYATYDQGSIKKSIPILEQPSTPLTVPEQFLNFWNQWGAAISYAFVGFALVIPAIFVIRRKTIKEKEQL